MFIKWFYPMKGETMRAKTSLRSWSAAVVLSLVVLSAQATAASASSITFSPDGGAVTPAVGGGFDVTITFPATTGNQYVCYQITIPTGTTFQSTTAGTQADGVVTLATRLNSGTQAITVRVAVSQTGSGSFAARMVGGATSGANPGVGLCEDADTFAGTKAFNWAPTAPTLTNVVAPADNTVLVNERFVVTADFDPGTARVRSLSSVFAGRLGSGECDGGSLVAGTRDFINEAPAVPGEYTFTAFATADCSFDPADALVKAEVELTVLGAALDPAFDAPVATADGFTVNVTNYDADFVFTPTVSAGSVTAGVAAGTNLPIIVSGLAPSASATVTVTTTRELYVDGSATVPGQALDATGSPPSGDATAAGVSFDCGSPPQVGTTVTCTVFGGSPNFDIIWQASYNPVFATGVVTLDGAGRGSFSFTVPREALGLPIGVQLVAHTAVRSIGAATGSVPTSIPAGEGTAPLLPAAPLLVLGAAALMIPAVVRRRMLQQ